MASAKCIRTRRLQRGAALLVLLAVLVLGASWFLVSRLDALSAGIFTPSNRNHNALVLSQAKQALIGYVAMNAAQAGENNPGRFPCPEGAALVGTSTEGISAPYVGPPNAPTCATVGRLPWRTLGLDKLVDSSAEPLWYVVSPGWQLVTSTTTLTINSNTIGQLNVDGQANAAVALIIAPGAAMNVLASAGCTARNQTRANPSPTIDARDYIECFNTGTSTFTTTGSTTSFNDQVVRITVADVMPGIEAAIASRVEREIAPLLRGVYATSSLLPHGWGTNISAGNPVYPFAAPFADPSLTASYQGNSASCAGGVCKGLLPVMFSNAPGTSTPCTPSAGSPCDPTFVRWVSPPAPVFTRTGGAALRSATCSVLAASVDCSITASGPLLGLPAPMSFTLAATVNNVGMAMRKFDETVSMTGIDPAGRDVRAQMASDGSARVTLSASMPISGGNLITDLLCALLGLACYQMNISMPITLLADHPVLNSADPTTGWFMRNEWYRVLYYAAAQTTTPAALPAAPACTAGTNCVTVSNLTPLPNNNKRAILILTGRSINGSARPSGTLADYLEFGNATGAYERQPVSTAVAPALKKPFNDRIVVVDIN